MSARPRSRASLCPSDIKTRHLYGKFKKSKRTTRSEPCRPVRKLKFIRASDVFADYEQRQLNHQLREVSICCNDMNILMNNINNTRLAIESRVRSVQEALNLDREWDGVYTPKEDDDELEDGYNSLNDAFYEDEDDEEDEDYVEEDEESEEKAFVPVDDLKIHTNVCLNESCDCNRVCSGVLGEDSLICKVAEDQPTPVTPLDVAPCSCGGCKAQDAFHAAFTAAARESGISPSMIVIKKC